jgi:hypothetical protein
VNSPGLYPDDELGHTTLVNTSEPAGEHGSLEFYIQDEVIAIELLQLSGQQLAESATTSMSAAETFKSSSLFQARTTFQSQLLNVLDRVVPLSAPQIPRPAVFLDYVPFIRQMVAADDIVERQYRELFERGSRVTRNSHKEELPARWISLSDEHRQILEATKFKGLDG